MAQKLTSYDIPKDLRDRINAMSDAEIKALQDTVKLPGHMTDKEIDPVVWWACETALRGNGVPRKRNPLGLSDEGYASLSQMLKETKVPLPPPETVEADLNSD